MVMRVAGMVAGLDLCVRHVAGPDWLCRDVCEGVALVLAGLWVLAWWLKIRVNWSEALMIHGLRLRNANWIEGSEETRCEAGFMKL